MNNLTKSKNRRASEIHQELLNGRNYSFSYVLGEMAEVLEALFKADISEMAMEISQVWYGLQMQWYQWTKWDFRLIGCKAMVDDFYARREIWKRIFGIYGKPFSSDYLVNGSNYNRPHKIQKALALAGVYISMTRAEDIAQEYKCDCSE